MISGATASQAMRMRTTAASSCAVAQLKALFSDGGRFYDRKNAKTPLTPLEQEAVGRILASCGAAEPVEFDAYTELFDFALRLTSEELVKRLEV